MTVKEMIDAANALQELGNVVERAINTLYMEDWPVQAEDLKRAWERVQEAVLR